jgi:group I intron endonuclease
MIKGIYTIKCLKNNKLLIGQSTNILRRFSQHKFYLKNNAHDNRHLQFAYNKYGLENFIFEILVTCEEDHLYSEENYWCNILNTHNDQFGYNIKPTNPNGCYRHSQETKLKIGEANKGKKHSEEFKKKCSVRMKGHVKTDEIKQKIKESSIGKKHSEESKQKMSLAKKGKKIIFSLEGRDAVSKAHKEWLALGLKNKKIIDELSGEIYNSVTECIRYLNISSAAFYRNINGKGRFKNKYKLSYVRAVK